MPSNKVQPSKNVTIIKKDQLSVSRQKQEVPPICPSLTPVTISNKPVRSSSEKTFAKKVADQKQRVRTNSDAVIKERKLSFSSVLSNNTKTEKPQSPLANQDNQKRRASSEKTEKPKGEFYVEQGKFKMTEKYEQLLVALSGRFRLGAILVNCALERDIRSLELFNVDTMKKWPAEYRRSILDLLSFICFVDDCLRTFEYLSRKFEQFGFIIITDVDQISILHFMEILMFHEKENFLVKIYKCLKTSVREQIYLKVLCHGSDELIEKIRLAEGQLKLKEWEKKLFFSTNHTLYSKLKTIFTSSFSNKHTA